jgi:chromosome segregation ATPase
MFFSIGDLITLGAVLLILIVYRVLDRNNRSLEKLKRFSDKIMENIAATVQEKTASVRDLSLELQDNLKTGREILKRSRDVEEALAGRAGEVEAIQKRLAEYDRVVADLAAASDKVEQDVARVRREGEFVDAIGRRLREVAGHLEKVEKRVPALEQQFAADGAKALAATRVELLAGLEQALGSMRKDIVATDAGVKDFAAYVARLEERTGQMEKEKIQAFSRAVDGFEAHLGSALARAAEHAESLEGEVFEKLARRIQADGEELSARVEALEQRIADWQGDIEYRFRSVQDTSSEVGSLAGQIHAAIEKTASEARGEMQVVAARLVEAWRAEASGAQAAKEEIQAGLAEVSAGLLELKQASYQGVSAKLAVFEDQFFADLRSRSSAVHEKVQAWQAETDKRVAEFEAEVKARVSASEEAARGLREGLRAEAEKARREASSQFEKEIQAVREGLETATRRLQREIDAGLKDLGADLAGGRKEMLEQLEAARAEAAALQAKAKAQIAETEAALAERMSALSAESAASVSAVRDAFAAQTEELVVKAGEERMALRGELKEMAGRVSGFQAELRQASETTMEKLRSDVQAFELESQKRMRELQTEVEGRIRDYRQLMADNREKAEAMQEKVVARIEEGSRMLQASLGEIDRRVKNFMSQTKLFERADTLKMSLDGTIDEMKKEIAKLNAERAGVAELEAELARTRKLADEVSGKLARFLAERRRIEEMEGDFKKIVALSREVDLKMDTLTSSNDSLQQIQARIRQFEELGKAVETGFERLEKKKEVLSVTSEGVDRTFQRLEGLEKNLQEADKETEALALKVQSLRGEFDLLAANKKDADSAMEIVGKLTGVLSDLEARMEKAQGAREWLARTETRFQEVAQAAQEQVRLMESIVKAESKKEKPDRGAPPLDKRETVVKLSHQGWSVQEISRVTQLSRGEVELILELAPKA